MVSAALLDDERRTRLDAINGTSLESAGIFALRSVLVTDDDAEARGLAAERLGLAEVARSDGSAARAARFALLDAASDPSPFVRERAVNALARHYEGAALEAPCEARIAEMIRFEPVWHVRRAAVRAIATIAGARATPILDAVLDDPFWRVRYAAIQALARLGTTLPEGGSARRRAALAFLRDGCAEIEPTEPERSFADDDDPLADDDPAVVAARLARLPENEVPGTSLVALLRSPHEVLRRLARKRLLTRANDEELLAVLALLDEPRIPYADDAARRLLARAASPAFRARVLLVSTSPTALVWALEVPPAIDLTRLATHPDARVRCAAIVAGASTLALEILVDAARDEDARVAAASITALGQRGESVPIPLPLGPPILARAFVASVEHLPRAALEIPDPAARSLAIGALDLGAEERATLQRDDDPWIRLAALEREDDRALREVLARDPDPWVRRGAFDVLLARREPVALAHAVTSDDAWVRSRAATAFAKSEPGRAIEALLRLTRDRTPMVRAAAAQSLETHDAVITACHALVASEPPIDEELRLAAHGRLVQARDARALRALAHDLEACELSTSARYALLGMALTYPEELRANMQLDFEPRPPRGAPARRAVVADVPRRPLGQTGLTVAPLGISGAHDLPVAELERARAAGVNLFFWEPEYRALGTFLERAENKSDLVVVAGSYEADARTIEKDIDRALARLRLESLGVMLLFWVRSPARLSDEAHGALVRAKEKGKVRAIGFSTHLRELATSAIIERPWDVVMARHSAAHPAIETTLLPVARERGVGVLAFSALVYGRMLASREISAADCYRYTLTQEGVSACLSAPRRQRELEENLAVLRKPMLDEADEARLRDHGEGVRAENRAFMSLVRGQP